MNKCFRCSLLNKNWEIHKKYNISNFPTFKYCKFSKAIHTTPQTSFTNCFRESLMRVFLLTLISFCLPFSFFSLHLITSLCLTRRSWVFFACLVEKRTTKYMGIHTNVDILGKKGQGEQTLPDTELSHHSVGLSCQTEFVLLSQILRG